MKTCAKCCTEKPYTEFRKDPRYKDGHQSYCKQCYKEYQKARRADPEQIVKIKAYEQQWYQENKERVAPRRREYDRNRWKNDVEFRERKRDEDRERYQSNPETQARKQAASRNFHHKRYRLDEAYRKDKLLRGKVHVRRRRMRVKEAGGKYTVAQWRELCAKYNHCCLCCGEKKDLSPDHIVPLSRGGTNSIDNIQPLCSICNIRKFTKTTDYRPKEE